MALAMSLGCRVWSEGDDFFVEGLGIGRALPQFTFHGGTRSPDGHGERGRRVCGTRRDHRRGGDGVVQLSALFSRPSIAPMSGQVIAIDGPAGSGSRPLRARSRTSLGWSFLDTGAMYRAVTREALHRGIDVATRTRVADVARGADDHDACLGSASTGATWTTRFAATTSTSPSRSWRPTRASAPRWCGANATSPPPSQSAPSWRAATSRRSSFRTPRVKVYLTASLEERARRRGDESEASVARRDVVDSTREASPFARPTTRSC